MFARVRISAIIVIGFVMTLNAQQVDRAIVGGTLVNTNGSEALDNATILLSGDKIVAVGGAADIEIPEGAEIIDVEGKWIIPGLIDAHVHFFQSGGLYTRPDVIDLRKHVPYAEQELMEIKERLPDTFARYIRSGITSVVDVGGPFWNFEVRDLAAKTDLAPTVAVAGPLISTYQPDALTTADPPIIKVKNKRAAKKLVRKLAAKNPDLIKIWYIVGRGTTAEDSYPLVKATIAEIHKLGYRAAVHATQLETARLAVKAGADVLVHSVNDKEVDDAFIQLLKDNGTIYIPAMVVLEGYPETFSQTAKFLPIEFEIANPFSMGSLFDLRHLPKEDIPKRIRNAMAAAEPVLPNANALTNLKRLQDAGVIIAAGTDAGNIGTLHGPSIFREFQLMAEAGLSPMDILIDATVHGARVMGRAADYGTIEAGKKADMVILDEDPLLDIMNTSRIHAVIKHGRYYPADEIIDVSPADIVQRQANAYNARDIDAFLATYSDDIDKGFEAFTHSDSLLWVGMDRMREIYGTLFENTPALHVEEIGRLVQGETVVVHERVTGLSEGGIIDSITIYETKGGLIRRVWFLMEQ